MNTVPALQTGPQNTQRAMQNLLKKTTKVASVDQMSNPDATHLAGPLVDMIHNCQPVETSVQVVQTVGDTFDSLPHVKA